jgi:hypothetical protein
MHDTKWFDAIGRIVICSAIAISIGSDLHDKKITLTDGCAPLGHHQKVLFLHTQRCGPHWIAKIPER